MNGENFDYTITAQYKNRTDITLSVTAYVSSILLYVYPAFVQGVKYAAVLQFISLALLTLGIFVSQRYSWQRFVYCIKPSENLNSGEISGHSFVVYKIQGKKKTTLADIPCRDLLKLVKCTAKDKKNEEFVGFEKTARYSFTQTMMPDTFYTAVFRADGGTAIIRFEPDETFVSILNTLKNKEKEE